MAPYPVQPHCCSASSSRVPATFFAPLPLSPASLHYLLSSSSPSVFPLFTHYSPSSSSSSLEPFNRLGNPSRCTLCCPSSFDYEELNGDFEEEGIEEVEFGEDEEISEIKLSESDEVTNRAARKDFMSMSQKSVLGEDIYEEKGSKRQDQEDLSRHIPDHLLPRVAIVGRPNVGKSALFNRLVGGNKAIVVNEPGVTRDRLYGKSFWGDCDFLVIDTGGVMTFSRLNNDVMEELSITTTIGMEGIPLALREEAVARMPAMIEKQAAIAVEEASVVIFLVDGQAGLTAADEEISVWLHKNYSKKPIFLAVNKCESPTKGLMQTADFWSLGFTPLPISAISGIGTGDLLDLVYSELQKVEAPASIKEEESRITSIAIVGRPNVGKSSILNALVGEDRSVVSPISGTTRDAIDTEYIAPDGQKYRLIDTAGIRRRSAVATRGNIIEALSVNRAFRAVWRSDVVALVIEAMACITEQDYKIAERVEREGKGCIIVVNKWDTIPKKNHETTKHYEQDVREKLRILDWAPIIYSSAKSGRSVETIIEAAKMVEGERSRRVSTFVLNQVVQEAVTFKPPPRTRAGKRGRIFYCTQAAIRPPTFVFFVNDASLFSDTYRRYMEKQLRSDAGFIGTPIRLFYRNRRKEAKECKDGDRG